jgi:hypothetical protein
MGRKRDIVRRYDDVDWRRGGTGMRKGGDDANWTDMDLTGLKIEENPRDRFRCYKWMVKI